MVPLNDAKKVKIYLDIIIEKTAYTEQKNVIFCFMSGCFFSTPDAQPFSWRGEDPAMRVTEGGAAGLRPYNDKKL